MSGIDGTGFPTIKQPVQQGRKIYPPPCERCGGKGKIKGTANRGVEYRRFGISPARRPVPPFRRELATNWSEARAMMEIIVAGRMYASGSKGLGAIWGPYLFVAGTIRSEPN